MANDKQWQNSQTDGKLNLGQGAASTQPTTTAAGAGEEIVDREKREEIEQRYGRTGSMARRDQPFSKGRRRQNDENTQYINVGRRRLVDQVVTPHTELLMEKFGEIIDSVNASQYSNVKLELHQLGRDAFAIPYDSILISRTEKIGTANIAHYHLFVIGSSRGELDKLTFEDRRYTLPNVCGDTPDDNVRTIDIILDTITENCQKLFRTLDCVNAGIRVIEAQADLTDDEKGKNANYTQLVSDAVETISTFIENAEGTFDDFDWSHIATGESGLAAVNTIDYNPPELKSSTGMPIHRQFTLKTSGYESSYERHNSETRVMSDISAFVDFRYGQADDIDDPAWLPVVVITDFSSEAGGNLLEFLGIGLGNLLQLRDDLQVLPAVDWRKKDPHNDLGVLGNLEPELFDLDKPQTIDITSVDKFFEIGRKALVPALEIAIDVSNTDRQSWLGSILGGACVEDSDEYDMVIAAMNSISSDKFGEYFFDDKAPSRDIILDADNFQIGGFYHGTNHERRDGREIGHLAVIAHAPKDLEQIQVYDDVTIGGTDVPYRNLAEQLRIKEEIVGRLTVTSYIRRYTFDPFFLECVSKALKQNYLLAPLDGAIAGPRERQRRMDDLRDRGSRSSRRGYSDRPRRR